MNKRPFMDEEFCEKIYRNGFSKGVFDYWEAMGVAQYLVWTSGFKKSRTKRVLIEWCEEHDKSFNKYLYRKQILSVVDIAMKKRPDKIVDVTVTKNEIDTIQKVKDFKVEKWLFALLVVAKREKFDTTSLTKRRNQKGYYVTVDDVYQIARLSSIRMRKEDIGFFIHKYVVDGYLLPTKVGKVGILYSDENSQPVLEVLGSEDAVKSYEKINRGDIIFCCDCNKPITKKSNRHVRCEECSQKRTRERNSQNVRKKREKDSVTV